MIAAPFIIIVRNVLFIFKNNFVSVRFYWKHPWKRHPRHANKSLIRLFASVFFINFARLLFGFSYHDVLPTIQWAPATCVHVTVDLSWTVCLHERTGTYTSRMTARIFPRTEITKRRRRPKTCLSQVSNFKKQILFLVFLRDLFYDQSLLFWCIPVGIRLLLSLAVPDLVYILSESKYKINDVS